MFISVAIVYSLRFIILYHSNGSDDNESEVEIVVEVQQENAEGAVWSEVVGGMNGGQDDHQSDLASQMATNDPTKTEEDQGARTSNPSKQVCLYIPKECLSVLNCIMNMKQLLCLLPGRGRGFSD